MAGRKDTLAAGLAALAIVRVSIDNKTVYLFDFDLTLF